MEIKSAENMPEEVVKIYIPKSSAGGAVNTTTAENESGDVKIYNCKPRDITRQNS